MFGKGKKSSSDLRELCVPGRVFFVKPRKLKEVRSVCFLYDHNDMFQSQLFAN